MKHLFCSIIAALLLSGCGTSQYAKWHSVCDPDHDVLSAAYSPFGLKQNCALGDRVLTGNVYTAPGILGRVNLENVFYVGDGMRWFNPNADDYKERTYGLTRVVFPYATEADYRQSLEPKRPA